MQFDITNLDKTLLIQTLFAHAAPLSLGQVQYEILKIRGDNVDGLTDEECEEILLPFYDLTDGHVKLLDYHKSNPMKLIFEKKRDGRILVDTDSYDARNGEYRFFEAMLDVFAFDEILITKKGYRQFTLTDLQEHLKRPKEQLKKFKTLLKNTNQVEKNGRKYWVIDETKADYKSNYMVQLDSE